MMTMTKILWPVWLVCLFTTAALPAQENPRAMRELPGPRCKVRTYNLNAIRPYLDGQWQGIVAATDGRVYFADSTHSGHEGGAIFRYDPAAARLDLLVPDVTRACGEDPAVNPQGKMHADFVEHKGWIYLATHFSSEFDGAHDTYTGAHVVGLEMATGKTRDFGAIHPGYTIYSGIGVDRGRDRIFAVTEPISWEQASATNGGTRLYAIDIKTGTKRDLGILNKTVHDSSSSFFVDNRGDCWFSLRSETGAFYRVNGETLKIDRYADALPKVTGEAWEDDNGMIWSRPIGDGSRCVLLKGDRWLWEFDSTKPITNAFTRLAEVGPAGLGTDCANGRVYFVRSADPKPRGGRYFDKRDDHHLYSVALGGTTVTDHGLIEDQDGRRPWRIHSLAADGRGRVYMTGDWYCLTETEGMRRYGGDRDGKPVYNQLRRGQFFAVYNPMADEVKTAAK
jgi:hypothetical protein